MPIDTFRHRLTKLVRRQREMGAVVGTLGRAISRSNLPSQFEDALEDIVGADRVLRNPAATRAYRVWRSGEGRGGAPKMIVLPRASEDVARLAVVARQAGVTFDVFGGGTGRQLRTPHTEVSPATEPAFCIVMRPLRKIQAVDQAARTVRAGAGATFSEIEAEVSSAGFALPVSIERQASGTIGAAVATDAWGRTVDGRASVRNFVTAVQVVRADGATVDLVDDVSASGLFDFAALMLDAHWYAPAVVAITEVEINLLAAPAARGRLFVRGTNLAMATSFSSQAANLDCQSMAIDYFGRDLVADAATRWPALVSAGLAAEALGKTQAETKAQAEPDAASEADAGHLLISFAGDADDVAAADAALRELVTRFDAACSLASQAETAALAGVLATEIFAAPVARPVGARPNDGSRAASSGTKDRLQVGGAAWMEIVVPVGVLADVIAACRTDARAHGSGLRVRASLRDGTVWVALRALHDLGQTAADRNNIGQDGGYNLSRTAIADRLSGIVAQWGGVVLDQQIGSGQAPRTSPQRPSSQGLSDR